MPKHIVRLLALFAVFGVVALGARAYFVDKSFGTYGTYRADAVPEIANAAPVFRGPTYCETCHTERFTQWSAGVHKVVICETCHGAAGTHPESRPPATTDTRTHSRMASARYDQVALSIPADSVKLCTLCHEKMPGRPARQRQIDVSAHAGTQQCTVCHNPHSPKIVVAALSKEPVKAGNVAAGKKKAEACITCHDVIGAEGDPGWPSLVGQQREYLVSALRAYRSGARRDSVMAEQAKDLSEADMTDLAAYYASLECKTAGTNAPSVASAGKERAASCGACHGAKGVSANPSWPNLAGAREVYLANALTAYRAGTRRDPMMAGPAKALTDADIKQLAAYYAGLECK